MDSEELKKKIVEIIIKAMWKDAEADYDSTDKTEACSIADALIAAGLVADVQSLADGNCVLYVKGKGFMRLYNEQDINEMIQRAEVNEKMFDILYEETSEYMKVLSKEWYKVQAEKELAEEEGRNV